MLEHEKTVVSTVGGTVGTTQPHSRVPKRTRASGLLQDVSMGRLQRRLMSEGLYITEDSRLSGLSQAVMHDVWRNEFCTGHPVT